MEGAFTGAFILSHSLIHLLNQWFVSTVRVRPSQHMEDTEHGPCAQAARVLAEDSGHHKEGDEGRQGKGQRDIEGKRDREREGGRKTDGAEREETEDGGSDFWLRDSGVHGHPSPPL